MNRKNLKEFATSLTALLFLVISISGVMLFFHFDFLSVKKMHEILGLFFTLFALLHVWTNWILMKKYFTKKLFLLLFVATFVVSGAFIVQDSGKTKAMNPKSYILSSFTDKPLDKVIDFLELDKTAVFKSLENSHYIFNTTSTLKENAKQNSISVFEFISKMIN